MASLNKVLLIGNLTRDPELRHTPSGTAVTDLGLAVSHKFKSGTGESRDETCFVRVTAWARQAETCCEYLHKGSPILVEGRLKYEEWEKDGQKHSRISVVSQRVQFMGSPRQRSDSGDAPGGAPVDESPAAPVDESPAAPAAGPSGDDDDLPF
jgi:single-strand DNA-binding protein